MKRNQTGYTSIELLILIFAIGYIMNIGWLIAAVIGEDFVDFPVELVLRGIGVVIAPLGAVLGVVPGAVF